MQSQSFHVRFTDPTTDVDYEAQCETFIAFGPKWSVSFFRRLADGQMLPIGDDDTRLAAYAYNPASDLHDRIDETFWGLE